MFNIRIVDMGNACQIKKHYSDVIQTREYRSPEVILEGHYDETADIWSLACMVFELATGDYLFEPKRGKTYTKDDDHLASITELIGTPKDLDWLFSNDGVDGFYSKKGKLKRIKKLKPWPLQDVLIEKYNMKYGEALFLSRFLNRMLAWRPKDRASAYKLLDDPWLKMAPEYSTRMSRPYHSEYMHANNPEYVSDESSSSS